MDFKGLLKNKVLWIVVVVLVVLLLVWKLM